MSKHLNLLTDDKGINNNKRTWNRQNYLPSVSIGGIFARVFYVKPVRFFRSVYDLLSCMIQNTHDLSWYVFWEGIWHTQIVMPRSWLFFVEILNNSSWSVKTDILFHSLFTLYTHTHAHIHTYRYRRVAFLILLLALWFEPG